jgi:hypothetical protein
MADSHPYHQQICAFLRYRGMYGEAFPCPNKPTAAANYFAWHLSSTALTNDTLRRMTGISLCPAHMNHPKYAVWKSPGREPGDGTLRDTVGEGEWQPK